jgi:hypothetical protein
MSGCTINNNKNKCFQYPTQNTMLLNKLTIFYEDVENNDKISKIIQGTSVVSLRIIDWFVTNFSKANYTVYNITKNDITSRFKVHNEYKLQLKSYSKKRFDPFCRWERMCMPCNQNTFIETTIGQLNFFKWAIENNIIEYIETHYSEIENDMNKRNSLTRKKDKKITVINNNKTRKRREELSILASKTIKKETVEITLSFN